MHVLSVLFTGESFSLEGVELANMLARDHFAPAAKAKVAAKAKDQEDDDETKRRKRAKYGPGYTAFFVRVLRAAVGGSIMLKDATVGKRPNLRLASTQSALGAAQERKLLKFGAPHPLVYARPSPAVAAGGQPRFAGSKGAPKLDFAVIDGCLAFLNMCCTIPLNPHDEQLKERMAIWGYSACNDFVGLISDPNDTTFAFTMASTIVCLENSRVQFQCRSLLYR